MNQADRFQFPTKLHSALIIVISILVSTKRNGIDGNATKKWQRTSIMYLISDVLQNSHNQITWMAGRPTESSIHTKLRPGKTFKTGNSGLFSFFIFADPSHLTVCYHYHMFFARTPPFPSRPYLCYRICFVSPRSSFCFHSH